jgi:hypothetical protein
LEHIEKVNGQSSLSHYVYCSQHNDLMTNDLLKNEYKVISSEVLLHA